MKTNYTNEKNVQILIALLKVHGIKKVIVSPGATNVTFVGSIQNDSFFELFSAVDERSAAYMACGLAAETGEPVVISCTGATASRNYLSGLTEAFYRKLPILAITSTQDISRVGHHLPQVIDRSTIQNDVAKLSVLLPSVKDEDGIWECELKINKAILELKRNGGGPVHINLTTTYSQVYDVKVLPSVRKIERITIVDEYPLLNGTIGIIVGSHRVWSKELENLLDKFCYVNNAVVFCDHTSSYKGKYRVLFPLVGCQESFDNSLSPDIVIHIGEITGDYYNMGYRAKQIWRVSEDGEIRDTYRKLRYLFEMPEQTFFSHYTNQNNSPSDSYLQKCRAKLKDLYNKIPELPLSNIWLASKMASRIPQNSTIHFAILNSLRSWNFFELPHTVIANCNVGGFGIDGGLSTLIGASLANKDRLYFCVIGDLAFFYDMNVLGNRHLSKNLRILLVNNGKGTEFRQYKHLASQFGDEADEFIAAAGHFGNKSIELVKHYAQDLGFDYISASNKQQVEDSMEIFLNERITDNPILFEVFTNSEDESNALEAIMNLDINVKGKVQELAKKAIGEVGKNAIKRIIGKA